MARARKPADLKAGKSETKEQLRIRSEIEKQLLGGTDKIGIVPEHLNELAKIYYQFLVNELEISGLLSNLDIPLLEQTADTLSKIRECDAALNRQGLVITGIDRYGNDFTKENPYVRIKMGYLNQFRNLANQLGLSPSARASLASKKIEAKEEEEDPLLKVLRGEA
ncbi:MAG TPA: phage terminase small subunit P27 family [Pseudoneobacillus sp.]|nr:phage terminase small subunit P27 family [Pseudoneobacillus sp.]